MESADRSPTGCGNALDRVLAGASPVRTRWSDIPKRPAPRGVVDERAFYFEQTSLPAVLRNNGEIPGERATDGHALRVMKPLVTVRSTIGLSGYYSGPDVHITDENALEDTFLARLPASPSHEWRAGHFARSLPRGYVETHWKGEYHIAATELRTLYEAVARVTPGDLFSLARRSNWFSTHFGQDGVAAQRYVISLPDGLLVDGELPAQSERPNSPDRRSHRLVKIAEKALSGDEPGRAAAAWMTADSLGVTGDAFWNLGYRLGVRPGDQDQGRLSMRILDICIQAEPANCQFLRALSESFYSQGEFRLAATAAKRSVRF